MCLKSIFIKNKVYSNWLTTLLSNRFESQNPVNSIELNWSIAITRTSDSQSVKLTTAEFLSTSFRSIGTSHYGDKHYQIKGQLNIWAFQFSLYIVIKVLVKP